MPNKTVDVMSTGAEYLYPPEQCPSACPKCGCKDNLQEDDSNYYVLTHETKEWSCGNCDFEWKEIYVFKRWEPKE